MCLHKRSKIHSLRGKFVQKHDFGLHKRAKSTHFGVFLSRAHLTSTHFGVFLSRAHLTSTHFAENLSKMALRENVWVENTLRGYNQIRTKEHNLAHGVQLPAAPALLTQPHHLHRHCCYHRYRHHRYHSHCRHSGATHYHAALISSGNDIEIAYTHGALVAWGYGRALPAALVALPRSSYILQKRQKIHFGQPVYCRAFLKNSW